MNMKGTKILVSLITLIAAFCLILGQSVSYAVQDLQSNPFYAGLSEARKISNPNTAYGIGNPSFDGGKNIWDLDSYSSETSTTPTNKTLYCVKGGFGHTWNDASSGDVNAKVAYKLGYDIKTEKSTIAGLSTRAAEYSNIAGANYNKILWILDNMYVPGESTTANKEALLKAAGIDLTSTDYRVFPITDDDIEVVQQMALWYYTNDDAYYHKDNLDSLFVSNSVTSNSYVSLDNYNYNNQVYEGRIRLGQMNLLYDYLLDLDGSNSSKYNSTNELDAPISIATTTLGLTESGDNYLVGPINITKNNDLPYSLDITVKDRNNNPIATTDSSFVDASGNAIDKNSATELYIKVAKSNGNKINVELKINYNTSTGTLWIPGTANNEQPIVEVVKVPHQIPVELSTNPSSPFDLSLRKFISGISSDASFETADYLTGTASREPQVNVTALKNGTATTATYTHSKEPLKVKNGDYIEYTIRVYNEGEADGYAEEVSDYILNNQGLEFAEGHATNTTYGWTKSGNTVKTNYLSRSKDATNNLIKAFNTTSGTTLDYKDIKIVFKVTEPNSSDNKLVNIAEVTNDCDENGNDVTDRDSTPGTDSKGYPNNGYNTENHEDDIDYEPVELYEFDLSLRKFISAISSDSTIDPSDYITGTNSREPQLSGAWRTDEPTTLVKEHSKEPLSVKNGDYVLYTIRVYNEGEIDGYASLIKDNIPEGLEFVSTDRDHNGIWTLQSDGSITTNWLARDNERNKISGQVDEGLAETNGLLKAYDPTKPISTTAGSLNPDYKDVQVLLRVTEPNTSTRTLVNRAQISEATDKEGNITTDRDSTPNNGYELNEDDEDYEPVVLEIFDLALRKTITKVGDTSIDTRMPNIDTTSLKNDTTATYKHTKQPVEVQPGDKVVYTIRVYNEGIVDGYASQIRDYLPEELEFIPASESTINSEYKWTISDNGRVATTDYLKDTKLNKRTENVGNTSNPYTLSARSIQIECRVKENVSTDKQITNIAEISEYKDENKVVLENDIDSKSNSLTDGDNNTGTLPTDENLPSYKGNSSNKSDLNDSNYFYKGQQDDDDFEKIIVPKRVDLALTKFITAISSDQTIDDNEYLTVNGGRASESNPYTRQTAVNTNPLKDGDTDAIYIQVKTPLEVTANAYVLYNIRVYNEGEVDVYAGEVTDYLPENLEFVDGEFNRQYGWTAEGQTVKTTYLSHA
ncbi:MAG: DUF11 domain-containing protein, partial [Clostridia bacterium]|nr:DUF11 domain-containing protein [Clostridia bacterium]